VRRGEASLQIQVKSPNVRVRPSSATVNESGHLVIGGCDTTVLAEQFGTPLWIMDEQTIRDAIACYRAGLAAYPDSLLVYGGKAFLTLAMCHLLESLGVGLDVVSEGELYTAEVAGFSPNRLYLHGNNKSRVEMANAIALGARIVVDNVAELKLAGELAHKHERQARVLFRLIPGVEPDTHDHIKTGQHDTKFGIPLEQLDDAIEIALSLERSIDLLGIHAHIGSQAFTIEPYLQNIEILAQAASTMQAKLGRPVKEIDVGGGLGIAYTDEDRPMAIYDWAFAVASHALKCFDRLGLPKLLVEPGRSIVGTAGVTLYRAGHLKELPSGKCYLSVDGGMADNPRPITYQAKYTACVANRVNATDSGKTVAIAGRFCESGDIIVKETKLAASRGDLVAIFGTGAYNYSMASNYNRSPRPACVLVANGAAEVIVERESNEDLIRKDRVPERLLRRPNE
jgi:diaminopimelate decarboxylase